MLYPAAPDDSVRWMLRATMLAFGRLVRVEGAERLRGVPEPAIFALLNLTETVFYA